MRFRIKQYVSTTTGIALLAAIGLVACNNGSNTSTSTNPGGGGTTPPMTLSYNIDGHNINGGASLSVFQDSGWHLLTLTANESYTATAIQGVAYRFDLNGSYGGINTPAGTAGLSVVTDPTLNTCATAVFQNQGDSCSVRFRIAYDTALSSTIPSNTSMVMFPGNYTTPNINFNSVPPFSVAPNPTQAVADIRVIQPVESSYWQSTAISESPNLYQIIQVQNGSPQESVNISTITALTNPNYFSLVNRSTPAGQNDPVYGSYAQCATSTTANPVNNQVSNLPALNNNCILVYQVTQQISQQAVESDIINIYFPNQQTNIFPSGNNTQQLIANYLPNFYSSNLKSDITISTIYYANNLWIAGSDGNGIYYSIDGKNWIQSNIAKGWFEHAPIFANDIWEIAGKDHGIYYSVDGKNWIQSNISSYSYDTPYYANGVWLANGNVDFMSYSTDGKTWTSLYNVGPMTGKVSYANNIWVASSNSPGSANAANYGAYYSSNGITWVQSNLPTTEGYSEPFYANGIWIVAGSYYGDGIYYSSDGITWTQSNITTGSYMPTATPVYANGIWVFGLEPNISGNGGGVYYSTDGKTWTQSNIPAGVSVGSAPAYANGIWLMAMNNNGTVNLYYSNDGITWTQTNPSIDFPEGTPYNANGVWVTYSDGVNGGLYYSYDGKNWTFSNNYIKKNLNTSGIYYANGIWSYFGEGLYYSLNELLSFTASVSNI